MSTVDALQTALAAEHAAVHLYGVLGAQTSASATPVLFAAVSDAYGAHRGRRDELARLVRDAGGTPDAAAPAYDLPDGTGTPQGVEAAAAEIEGRCATTYAWVVANTAGETRRWAVRALTSTAVRGLVFRGSPEMFPGADEYADR